MKINKQKIINGICAIIIAFILFLISGASSYASEEAAAAGVYVKQMGSGYCTLASACDMIRSKMYLEGNASWPNVTQQKMKSTAWLNGAGLYHQFTYYGTTVTYSTNKCNTKEALINLLKEHPEGIEIYIRDLPHAVLLTRYDQSTGIFYVADPVYEGERSLMTSWQRKAGSTQDAVIRTIDAYWYISKYTNQIIPGGLVGQVAAPTIQDILPEDEEWGIIDDEDGILDDDVFVKSTIQLPYINDYNQTNFMDVQENAWYFPYIKAVYEMGMMIGVSNNEFHVDGNITLAQSICIAARLHSAYYEDGYEFIAENGEPWFMPYVNYAIEQKIVNEDYIFKGTDIVKYDKEALRIEFAEILSKALPKDQMTKIKEVQVITDIPAGSNNEKYQIVYDLYNAGILVGDGEGFKPYKKITRAEIAAIISRMADASLRIE